MQSQPIEFFHRGALRKVESLDPTQTVLQWLREVERCSGTKEGCNEGDCGACTVVVGTPTEDGKLNLKAVNSCIQFLPTLHGKALITVEDLAQRGELHPCQKAMVDCHGSQCGFCTPGFVMTLFAHYEAQRRAGNGAASRVEIDELLSGNLCRCTGYKPIIEAAQTMFLAPQVSWEDAPALSALAHLDDASIPPETFTHTCGANSFVSPRTRADFAMYRADNPDARILAGSTDIGIWVNKQFRALPLLLYIGNVGDLDFVRVRNDRLQIGAAVNLENAFDAIAREIIPKNKSWHALWRRFASPLIRNAGTLAGNIANGSPIGDAMPALIALGAQIILQNRETLREIALEDFYLAYQKTALQPGEFVAEIHIPIPPKATSRAVFRTYKISKRFDQDISAVCFAAALEFENDLVIAARIAFGGMAGTPMRARHAQAALVGKRWNEENLRAAMLALKNDFTPLNDMRASADYRMTVAQNLLHRMWLETATPSSEIAPQVLHSVHDVNIAS